MKDTNAKLRGWMAENKVKGVTLAKAIGMPYDTFKNKMSGRSEWRFGEISKVLKFTGRTFEELF